MTVTGVSGLTGTGGGVCGSNGSSGSTDGLFGSLLSESAEELKKKREQGLVTSLGSGISILGLSGLASGDSTSSGDEVGAGEGGSSLASGGSATDQAAKLLHDMTSDGLNGYWKWYVSQLRDKVRADVMKGMDVTDQSLAAMPADQRVATEKAIDDAVTKKVKELLEEQMKKSAGGQDAGKVLAELGL